MSYWKMNYFLSQYCTLYRTFHNNHFTVYLFMFHHGQNGRGFAHYKAVILWEWKKHEIRYLIQISNKLKW